MANQFVKQVLSSYLAFVASTLLVIAYFNCFLWAVVGTQMLLTYNTFYGVVLTGIDIILFAGVLPRVLFKVIDYIFDILTVRNNR